MRIPRLDRRVGRRRTTFVGVATLVGVTAVATAVGARADMGVPIDLPRSPPPWRSARVTATLDWGVFADRVSRPYTVRPGDTLRAIAAAQLGAASRVQVLAEANRDVAPDPDRIAPGDVLWLPPARAFDPPPPAGPPTLPPDAALERWYDAFWTTRGPYQELVGDRAAPPAATVPPRGGLLLVPHAHTASLLAARARGPVTTGDSRIGPSLTATLQVDDRVHVTEPTTEIHVVCRLAGRLGAALTLTTDERRLDAAGAVVTRRVPLDTPSEPRPAPWGLLLGTPTQGAGADPAAAPGGDDVRWPPWLGLLVAAAGGATVAGLALRRRRRSPVA